MLFAFALSIAGLGLLCWLLFALAVHALPALVGVLAGLLAYRTGAGPVGSALVGVFAGSLALMLCQALFAATSSLAVRLLVVVGHAVPAGVVGYLAVRGLSAIGTPSELWREAFAVSGAVLCAGVAWARLSALRPDQAGGQPSSPDG